mgnify:CR=1 FL=1
MAWDFGLSDAISIGGGIADFFSSRESDKAQQQRAAADRAAADQRTSQLIEQSSKTVPKDTDFFAADAEGFSRQRGGQESALARELGARGDIARTQAANLNMLPNFQLPTLADAQAVVAGDTARQRETVIDPALRNFAIQANRANRDNNPALFGQFNKNLQELQGSLRQDEGTRALDLFNKQRQSDIGNQQALLNTLVNRVQAPAFANDPSVATNAPAYIAQTPIPGNVANVSPAASAFGSISNQVAQYQQRRSEQESNKLLIELMRQMGNQNA